ncbi:hypothetical protein [Bradyrhizobium zhanjiangense]|uniref:Uncharacterized protein n=1 Tax=Bradyrhizobium zhanjiangense TaxID=1325107 RepID=A0A4Q0SSF6_9BRAD|nr:hypothetical protein [Bradyrhizobium zhanjiangense]RXH41071.1 hypothetical protein XH94_09515 [Bradyrhizobium zhanjiangense]
MRRISAKEFYRVCGRDDGQIRMHRLRNQAIGAFGCAAFFPKTTGLIALDLVAFKLTDVLTEKLRRTHAAIIVRDAWQAWTAVVAVAEATTDPVFLYVLDCENLRGERTTITTGSTLDSRSDRNLMQIAEDVRRNTGLTPKSYVVIEMQSVLADVRRAAKQAKVDLSGPFLPPYGSPELAELLSGEDGAVVVTADAAERVKRAGLAAREMIEKREPR